jgi:hypothetical protein
MILPTADLYLSSEFVSLTVKSLSPDGDHS